ncbi:MAG: hypothetical protein DWQ36_06310 [Acidobacteria bacterium]|nr:MAG: hypothetical protein DWQ30_19315 [Acidobacteriota bacterium]REK09658.1 MAG: hypothetical protein DWQ36_06310 [Acidobacteriota bacterium]
MSSDDSRTPAPASSDERTPESVDGGSAASGDDQPTLDQVQDHRSRERMSSGQRIGPYRLERQLGEGGMGEVWQAQQLEPVQRRVAIKMVKWGMDTRAVIARFESERQALALMDHPAIAKVFDGGATESGRPYFVMELVQGESITSYCDRYRLSTRARLDLMRQVCDGVHHAHQKGIIHRDIKPGNVLVSRVDDRPVVKIIDFGIAKATARHLTEQTVFTQLGQWIGTPVYMSPEQAEHTGLDIDTRSDVYSLGVLLYELLVGVPPLDPEELRKAGFDEVRRRIRETDPLRPSTQITTRGELAREIAQRRSTDPRALARRLRGDLDWIALRALEKDRTRRYASASELSADIARSLRDEPVLAGPPSASYRARKFVRRHRVGVAFASVVAGLVLALLVTTLVQARRVAKERDRANLEAETAREISGFLVGLFEEADPSRSRGTEVTAREVLDRGVQTIREDFERDPDARANLMQTMGRVYTALGLYDDARPLIEDTVEVRETMLGESPELADALDELAKVMHWQGEYEAGLAVAERALALREGLQGPEQPELGRSLNNFGNLLEKNGRLEEARAAHQRAADLRERVLGPEHEELAQSLHNLAVLALAREDFADAEQLLLRSAEIERLNGGDESYGRATSLHVLAILYEQQGRYEEAIPIELEALGIRERVLGEDHPHVSFSLTTLGNIYRAVGRAEDAEPLLRRAVEIAEASWDFGYGEVRWIHRSLAGCLEELGRAAEAEGRLLDVISRTEALGQRREEALIPTLEALAAMYRRQGRLGEARPALSRWLEIEERVSGRTSPLVISALLPLAALERESGRQVEAERYCRRALDIAGSLPDDARERRAVDDACG